MTETKAKTENRRLRWIFGLGVPLGILIGTFISFSTWDPSTEFSFLKWIEVSGVMITGVLLLLIPIINELISEPKESALPEADGQVQTTIAKTEVQAGIQGVYTAIQLHKHSKDAVSIPICLPTQGSEFTDGFAITLAELNGKTSDPDTYIMGTESYLTALTDQLKAAPETLSNNEVQHLLQLAYDQCLPLLENATGSSRNGVDYTHALFNFMLGNTQDYILYY